MFKQVNHIYKNKQNNNLAVVSLYNNMKTIKHFLLIIFYKATFIPQWGLIVMSLCIKIELVSEQLIGKCLTLTYCIMTKMFLCL